MVFKFSRCVVTAFSVALTASAFAAPPPAASPSISINDLIVHDPHILADAPTRTYYLYGQFSPKRDWQAKLLPSQGGRGGVLVYTSKDLATWTAPQLVFEIPDGFWADATDAPWAPEVHAWRGKYYLFCTFNDWNTKIDDRPGRPPITKRQTQILVGDSPLGPFKPFSNTPSSPAGTMALDGTFYVDPSGAPWFIYAHEWIQITDGSFEAIRLRDDLSTTLGDPLTLIRASEVDWTKRAINYKGGPPVPGIVTDGASLYRMKSGVLALFWASWSKDRLYAESIAYSDNGKLAGPWRHEPAPILQDDVGHGSVFTAFDGRLLLVIHKYFKQPATRVQIYELEELADRIRVKRQILGAP